MGKGGRCVGLKTLPPSCADFLEVLVPQPPGALKACPGLQRDRFTSFMKLQIELLLEYYVEIKYVGHFVVLFSLLPISNLIGCRSKNSSRQSQFLCRKVLLLHVSSQL